MLARVEQPLHWSGVAQSLPAAHVGAISHKRACPLKTSLTSGPAPQHTHTLDSPSCLLPPPPRLAILPGPHPTQHTLQVRYGAERVFASEASNITDEDVDALIAKGEAATKELNDKLQAFTNDAMRFTMDGGISGGWRGGEGEGGGVG